MFANSDPTPAIALRPPSQVMRLSRLGAFHQTRLSFMRILLRRLLREGWQMSRPLFDIDVRGVGRAVYTFQGPERAYSLVAFGHDLPPEQRSDRVIATAWDATFTLFDGVPGAADLARLARNVPLQEAGRVTPSELTVARANRSVRLFDHVVDCLAGGRQPDRTQVDSVGYLMRTTAVYGSGKLGAADREDLAQRPECAAPFQVEMLTVYLIRSFVMDLVEHMAALRGPGAVKLAPELRHRFGIGNSTGLGMAPFLLNHPMLLNNWIAARETALSRVRGIPLADPAAIAVLRDRAHRARQNWREWRSDHPGQRAQLARLDTDLLLLERHLAQCDLTVFHPWDALWRWGEANLGEEGQELLLSLVLEPHGALIDDLETAMSADEAMAFRIDGAMTVAQLRALILAHYDWALGIDWSTREAQARVWYTSAEKQEPRLGERFDEPIAAYEQPLSPARDVVRLFSDLERYDNTEPVAKLLLAQPEHRHILRRVQIVARYPYGEINDNTIAAEMRPIDMLRAKLSFFGAGHFDPRSDRWVRINMFRNAPFPDEPGRDASGWSYPPLP